MSESSPALILALVFIFTQIPLVVNFSILPLRIFEKECDLANGIVIFTTFMFFCIPYISFLELISEVHFVIKVATPFITPPFTMARERGRKRGERGLMQRI